MLLRAFVVLLVILNVGVAVWWAVRDAPADPAVVQDPESTTLVLVSEAPSRGDVAAPAGPAPAPADDAATPAVVEATPAASPAAATQCVTLGPFAEAALRDAALARVATVSADARPRDVGDAPRGWRVSMPPLPDRASADAMVARLLEAGFNDYYVIADGAQANGIALGRFGSEASARARAGALRAAGFDADVSPLGNPSTRYWIDATVVDTGSVEALRAAAGAARAQSRDCDAPRDAG